MSTIHRRRIQPGRHLMVRRIGGSRALGAWVWQGSGLPEAIGRALALRQGSRRGLVAARPVVRAGADYNLTISAHAD